MSKETNESNSSLSSAESPGLQNEISQVKSTYQRVYNAFGFTKAYNFPLYVIFAGAMFGFSLSRLQFYNYNKIFSVNINPGYMYYFRSGSYRVGMLMHLCGCLPAGILMVLQFVPAIRHFSIIFHRINGYIVLILLLISNAGACIVLPHPDSGTRVGIQSAEAMLVILTTCSLTMAYWNIRRLQIDQHRAWMIRSMFIFGVIISSRIIDNIAAVIISRIGTYYTVWTCDQIDYTYRQFGIEGILEKKYPQCLIPNGTLDGRVVVKAVHSVLEPESAGASGSIPFGAALWISLVVHLIGVEIYLNLTPREAQRLRQVSYERQLAAGYKKPGNGGWTVERFGDAEEWRPKDMEA
ncbi:hypothetical protein F5884DRAFT_687721 [Xylogone sp. PMI_703]|nr:hypothetical protein F5884DRAFT_687721 [Xylogone sp. PMI_703]